MLAGWLPLVAAPGRMALTAAGARFLLRQVEPGHYPRGGRIHLRLWLAERLADELGAANLAGAAWMPTYARLLGAKVGKRVDLHSIPPVTGMLTPRQRLLGRARGRPVRALAGRRRPPHRSRSRSARGPASARAARSARVRSSAGTPRSLPAPAVVGTVTKGEYWTGSPAEPVGRTRGPWSEQRPQYRPVWVLAYAGIADPDLAAADRGRPWPGSPSPSRPCVTRTRSAGRPSSCSPSCRRPHWSAWPSLALLVALLVRLLGIGLAPGAYPIHSLRAWQAWATMRVLDEARTWLFPLYSSALTPMWLRLLGARVGRRVEASTVLLIPKLTSINDEAFLADDTLHREL